MLIKCNFLVGKIMMELNSGLAIIPCLSFTAHVQLTAIIFLFRLLHELTRGFRHRSSKSPCSLMMRSPDQFTRFFRTFPS